MNYLPIQILTAKDVGVSFPVMACELMRILHGHFKNEPGKYGVTFGPHGSASIRVFAKDMSDLAKLQKAVGGHEYVRDYARFGFPQAVSADYAGPRVCFKRLRFADRRNMIRAGTNDFEIELGKRHERVRRAHEMVFANGRSLKLRMGSASTKQTFPLMIQAIEGEEAPSLADNHQFDSYGLSTPTRMASLPDPAWEDF